MNDQTLPLGATIPSEVRLFLAAVRRELGDLGPDEVTEMTDGLEADLTDLVAERGPEALGDPRAYARELRAAAGVAATGDAPRERREIRASMTAFLDACHGWFDQQVERIPGDPQPVIAWLRPAWWLVRAWVAVTLLAVAVGGGYGESWLVPSVGGFGWLVLPVALVVSVMIGLGRIWPGGTRGLFARLVLVGLNGFAIAMTPVAVDWANNPGDGYGEWESGYEQGLIDAGSPGSMEGQLLLDGKAVTNIFPFDAEGRRLAGVQLFDQEGRPLDVLAEPSCPQGEHIWRELQVSETGEWSGEREVCFDSSAGSNVPGTVLYPWTNGQAQLKNVFPLASRQQDLLEPSATAFQEAEPPTLGEWPFATVPKVSLPGIVAGVIDAAATAEAATVPTKAPKPKAAR